MSSGDSVVSTQRPPFTTPHHNASNGDITASYWKNQLLLLQEQAPKPSLVPCAHLDVGSSRPNFYGDEFHGLISREQTEDLLGHLEDGAYLVRESARALGAFTLCMRWDGVTRNYKLYYDDDSQTHYVGEKRFENLHDLVADGLIQMYIEKHAADYIRRMAEDTIYEQSPYSMYQRQVKKQKERGSPSVCNSCAQQSTKRTPTSPSMEKDSASSRSNSSAQSYTPPPGGAAQPVKAHSFKPHTWRAGAHCEYCGNWMWGLIQQGFQCADCGFRAHRSCSERVPQDCQPSINFVKRMFNIDLTTLTMAHSTLVPPVVTKCIAEIERRGLDTEGLYRVGGSKEVMDNLHHQFDSKGDANLSSVEDVHCVAALLKMYLRQLPIPLITLSTYRAILSLLARVGSSGSQTAREEHCARELTRLLPEEMPTAHYNTLAYLMLHLNRVSRQSDRNRMNSTNITLIFAPSLMPTGANPVEALSRAQYEHYFLQILISHAPRIFHSSTVAMMRP